MAFAESKKVKVEKKSEKNGKTEKKAGGGEGIREREKR